MMGALVTAAIMRQAPSGQGSTLKPTSLIRVTAVRYTGFFSESPGAIGVPYLDASTPLSADFWQDFPAMLGRSVRVAKPINLMSLRLKVVLSSGIQVLFDERSRFIRASSKLEAITSYNGPVYELSSVDFRDVLAKILLSGRGL